MADYIVSNCLTIHPDVLYMYGKIEWIDARPFTSFQLDNFKKGNLNRNKLSEVAIRKMSKSIKYLLYNSHEKIATNNKTGKKFKFKIGFITLTLPSHQEHSDQEIKHVILNQFFVEAKRKWGMNSYVWKSERQRNGNIHFHILTDVFIPYRELRTVWNRITDKLGYVQVFAKSHGHADPNSTDIHSMSKIKNVTAYLTKYMVKKTFLNRIKMARDIKEHGRKKLYSEQTVTNGAKEYLYSMSNNGRIWGCSYDLTNLTGGTEELDNKILNEIGRLQREIGSKRINKDNLSMVFFDNQYLNPEKYPELCRIFFEFTSSKFCKRGKQLIFNDYLPPS